MQALAVNYSGLLGGAERVLLEVATGLPEPPLLACPAGPLATAARERGLGVFELRERSLALRRSARDRMAMPLRIVAQAAEVHRLVAAQQPDVLIAWGMRAGLVLGAAYPRGRGRPPLLFQHNDLLPGPLVARAVRAAAARADMVVACSECAARELDPERVVGIRVIPPGVDLMRFRPARERDRDAAHAFSTRGEPGAADGLRGEPREVLVLGAMERWKRPDLALEAVALAAERLPDLRVRVVGAPIGVDGQRLVEELRARASWRDLDGRVELAAALADPVPALRRATCLLHCADREPYGMVVAEALASGVPVVAPASCGPTEIVDDRCARLFEPGSATAAAHALVAVLGEDATTETMRAAARARAEEHLDLERTRRDYTEAIELLAGSGSRRRPGASPRPASSRGDAGTTPGGGAPDTAPGTAGSTAARRAGGQLAIVTVIHDSEPELRALLDSIERHLPGAQVVVVDSGSQDGGPGLARDWRDGHAKLVGLGENAGFGRGVNAGLAHVRRPLVALLNPDVELLDASLAAAAREAECHPDRLLAPLVLHPDGERQDIAQQEPGRMLLTLHALAPGAALGRPLATAVEPWRSRAPRPAGWAVGCALVADAASLRRLGPFDERVFMYGEDLDLGLRAADAQLETWFWPAARVRHIGAHSTSRVFGGEPLELLARRRRAVVRERRGPRRAVADDLLQAATFANRGLLKALLRRDGSREWGQLKALRDARGTRP